MTAVSERESLARVRRVFAAHPVPGVLSVYVFGSIAEGRAHAESDIDLGVLFDRDVYPDERSRFEAQLDLRRYLSPASVGREVDVVVQGFGFFFFFRTDFVFALSSRSGRSLPTTSIG